MKVVILARIVDAFEKKYTSKRTNKDVHGYTLSVIDDDAFYDSDRVQAYFATSDEIINNYKPDDLVGKTWHISGVLSKYDGSLTFRPESIKLAQEK